MSIFLEENFKKKIQDEEGRGDEQEDEGVPNIVIGSCIFSSFLSTWRLSSSLDSDRSSSNNIAN